MRVLALNPPFHRRYSRSQRSPAVIKSGVLYYPLWLAYAVGVLEQDGFQVKLVDAPAAGLDLAAVLGLAEGFRPHLAVLDTGTPSIHNDVAVAAAIKKRLPGTFVLLVGPHVTARPEETLRLDPAIDAVARGEYDYTVRDLARALAGAKGSAAPLDHLEGLSWRDGAGSVLHNPDRPLIEDLDAVPFVSQVYRRHLRVEDYFYSIARHPPLTIVTGRGCPHRCSFCLWPATLTGHRYRRRSVASVADEVVAVAHDLPQVREIVIEDDTLTADPERCIALARELIRRGNRLPFTANARADMDPEALRELKQAGLRLLCVGFESGDQAVLDALGKGARVEDFYRFREAARQAGVRVHGCFMAGGPGETPATLARTLQLALELSPDTAQFFPLMPYPGSPAYDWARREGYLAGEDYHTWLTRDGLHNTVLNLPGLPAAELVAWCDRARRAFYLRPHYLAARAWEMVTQPAEAGRIWRAGRTFARYLFPTRPRTPREGG